MDQFKAAWKTVEKWITESVQQGVCVQCHRRLGEGQRYVVADIDGSDVKFCSHNCVYRYWQECGQYGRTPAGSRGQSLVHSRSSFPVSLTCHIIVPLMYRRRSHDH